MNDKLYKYLEKEWRFSNHPKYQKYFTEWVSNATTEQLEHFERMMISGNIYGK